MNGKEKPVFAANAQIDLNHRQFQSQSILV